MPQALFRKNDDLIDYYNSGSALLSGAVVITADRKFAIVNGLRGIAASESGTLAASGHADVAKVTGALSVGDRVFWNAAGDPVGGTAGTGALTGSAGNGYTFAGTVETAAASGDATVRILFGRAAGGTGDVASASVTATTGGATTGLIPASATFATVTSDSADKQISLPAGYVGKVLRILVGTTACELISAVAADKVNEVTVGATNELALTAEALYTCVYTKSGFWIVNGQTKLGAAQAALVPDAL